MPRWRGSGSAVQMTEDAPPSDMNGTDENPDAPKDVSNTTVDGRRRRSRSSRPAIRSKRRCGRSRCRRTCPRSRSRPHAGLAGTPTTALLRARYGITREVQLGLTYVLGGIYDDPATTRRTGKASTPARRSASTSPCCSRTGSRCASACRSTSIRSRSALAARRADQVHVRRQVRARRPRRLS